MQFSAKIESVTWKQSMIPHNMETKHDTTNNRAKVAYLKRISEEQRQEPQKLSWVPFLVKMVSVALKLSTKE